MAGPSGPAYKAALSDRLDEHRSERCSHLTHSRYETMRELISEFSDVFVVDGAPLRCRRFALVLF